jgi:hypothetical protein
MAFHDDTYFVERFGLANYFVRKNTIGLTSSTIFMSALSNRLTMIDYRHDKKVYCFDFAGYFLVGFVKSFDKADYPFGKKVKSIVKADYFYAGLDELFDKAGNF